MTWTGTWRNQYDSVVVIDDESGGRLTGTFRTAIESSPFAGSDVAITGVHSGDAFSFVCATNDDAPGTVVSYTGKLEGGRMESLWFVVAGDRDWWTSVTTNHDTFDRV